MRYTVVLEQESDGGYVAKGSAFQSCLAIDIGRVRITVRGSRDLSSLTQIQENKSDL